MKCLVFAFVGFLAASASAEVDYNEVAKAIFKDFVIGPVDVGTLNKDHFDYKGKTVNYNITNAVIRKINSARLHGLGPHAFGSVTDGHPLKKLPQLDEYGYIMPVQSVKNLHSMEVLINLGRLTMDSKLSYRKTGETVKQVNLVSSTIEEHRWIRGVQTTVIFDAVKRVVLGYEHVFTTITAYDSTSNCQDNEAGFCDALHDRLRQYLYIFDITAKLGAEVKRMLIGRKF